MLLNLKKEIQKSETTQERIAKDLGITEGQFSKKVNGKYEFTRVEMYKIHDKFFPDTDMYYLFNSDN